MSLLVRAALLGGLAYVVSRAVRKADGSAFLSRSDADRITRSNAGRISRLDKGVVARDSDGDSDLEWKRTDQPSIIQA